MNSDTPETDLIVASTPGRAHLRTHARKMERERDHWRREYEAERAANHTLREKIARLNVGLADDNDDGQRLRGDS